MEEQLQAIIIRKKEELLRTNPMTIGYSILSEEILDAEYALENIHNKDALYNIHSCTTSDSIYDLLTDFFVNLAHE